MVVVGVGSGWAGGWVVVPLTGGDEHSQRDKGPRKLKVELSWCSDDETINIESIKACPTPAAAKATCKPKPSKPSKERVRILLWSAFKVKTFKESNNSIYKDNEPYTFNVKSQVNPQLK